MGLPRELWVIILKIKWWKARVNRLEKILKFPKLIILNEKSFIFDSGPHRLLMFFSIFGEGIFHYFWSINRFFTRYIHNYT